MLAATKEIKIVSARESLLVFSSFLFKAMFLVIFVSVIFFSCRKMAPKQKSWKIFCALLILLIHNGSAGLTFKKVFSLSQTFTSYLFLRDEEKSIFVPKGKDGRIKFFTLCDNL